jgi:methylthioribose-1-phosphate isomerase
MIDQRLLPEKLDYLDLRGPEEVAQAIASMAVRGAPAIGAAAAFGLALAAHTSPASSAAALLGDMEQAAQSLRATRPTAVNLAWALERVMRQARRAEPQGAQAVRRAALTEAQAIADEDVEINRRIGEHGAALLEDGDMVIHHCNTGALATVDIGTALGVIRTAHEQGKRLHVLVDETRPRFQGARLTAWELQRYGISYDIITDNAAGHFLRSGQVAAVLVGADRVAANGDVANKIGTYMLALAANANRVPFYVAVPLSTVDLNTPRGEDIAIEMRHPGEVLQVKYQGRAIAPSGASARNPAFDITPHTLISALITELGVLEPPFAAALQRAKQEAEGQ